MGVMCSYCSAASSERCVRCNSISYCSKACRASDWETHQFICDEYKQLDPNTRPTRSHCLAFFFPADEDKPMLAWIDTTFHEKEKYVRINSDDLDIFLGLTSSRTAPMLVQYNERTKMRLQDFIVIKQRDTCLTDGCKLNPGILQLVPNSYWRGPLVAVAQIGTSSKPTGYRDVNPMDFGHLVDHFRSHAARTDKGPSTVPWDSPRPNGGQDAPVTVQLSAPAKVRRLSPATGVTVKGVRINCPGDQVNGKPKYEPVEVPLSDAVFTHGEKSGISILINLPVLARKCDIDSASQNVKLEGASNESASHMYVCCDPEAKNDGDNSGFGRIPMRWLAAVGSVLVVREDKKPLTPFHAEVLADYCQFRARPYFLHARGEYWPCERMTPMEVCSAITMKTFYIFFAEACCKHRKHLQELASSISSAEEKAWLDTAWKSFKECPPPHQM